MARRRKVFTSAWLLALGVSAGVAQIPQEFTNLRVLPDDIPQPELVDTMRGFASALDVDCSHCHGGSDPDDLSTFDFASDEKPTKRTARLMIEMVRAINEQYLPRTGKQPSELLRVGCVTCHNGKARPESLGDALAAALAEGGVEAAIAEYRDLRERFYGRSAYDFGPDSLVELGRRLARQGNPEQAVAMLELNLEYFPDSPWTLLTLGETQLQMGDREAATATYEKLVQVEPENSWARARLDELRGAPNEP